MSAKGHRHDYQPSGLDDRYEVCANRRGCTERIRLREHTPARGEHGEPVAAYARPTPVAASAAATTPAAAREEALDRVEAAVPHEWAVAAYQSLRAVLATSAEIVGADVWRELERQGFDPPPEPRAMGVIFRRAAGAGLIAPTEQYRASGRVEDHDRLQRVWRRLG